MRCTRERVEPRGRNDGVEVVFPGVVVYVCISDAYILVVYGQVGSIAPPP